MISVRLHLPTVAPNCGKCVGCLNFIQNRESLTCAGCKKKFDISCTKISSKRFHSFYLAGSNRKNNWHCSLKFTNKAPKHDSPIALTTPFSVIILILTIGTLHQEKYHKTKVHIFDYNQGKYYISHHPEIIEYSLTTQLRVNIDISNMLSSPRLHLLLLDLSITMAKA